MNLQIMFKRNIVKFLVVAFLILLATHLSSPDNIPFRSSYRFPLGHFLLTLSESILMLLLIEGIFNYFEKKVFSKEASARTLVYFLLTATVLSGMLYSLLYPIIITLLGYDGGLYAFVVSLIVTLVLIALITLLVYGKRLLEHMKPKSASQRLQVKSGRTIEMVPIDEISGFFSRHKTVYLLTRSGKQLSTNFTLDQLEKSMDPAVFFRANRQCLICEYAVTSVLPGDNDKLLVTLRTDVAIENPITISRYKAASFKKWFVAAQSDLPLR